MTTMCVDGNNVLIRALKAMEHTSLSSHGVSTGALLVFINALSRYVRLEQPHRLVVCWDGGRSFYRTSLYPQYKSNRKELSETERNSKDSAFALAKEFLTLSNIHHIEFPAIEADDLIGAYWRQRDVNDRFVIVSNDKDFFQLLEGKTVQLRQIKTGELAEEWDETRVIAEMGCHPRLVPSIMALAGDSGDSVPHVPKCGVKTAWKWLVAHDWDLNKLIATSDEKIASKISGYHDLIKMSLKLVDLRNELFDLRVSQPPVFVPTIPGNALWLDLVNFLNSYELNSILEKLVTGTLWYNPSSEAP